MATIRNITLNRETGSNSLSLDVWRRAVEKVWGTCVGPECLDSVSHPNSLRYSIHKKDFNHFA